MKTSQKIIYWLFAVLLFFVPLILWPFTSEVFEFNKMVLVYALTILITGTWIVRMIIEKKFIFRRTILDIPLLVFLGSQLISTLLSIDPITSWLGYYSRFNGGLLSTICYLLLYWMFVSNIDAKKTLKLIYVTLASAALVSVYGVLEHFGIDKNIWVQDVQSRVFSTLGQPNWLASWLVALIPIAWALALNSKPTFKSKSFWVFLSFSLLYFWTLLFTKSRSGLAGFGVMYIIFWGIYFWVKRGEFKEYLIPFGIISFSILIASLISGTQYTPSLSNLLRRQSTINNQQLTTASGGTALETGGTESSVIRKIVWKGAVQVWLHYPIFGSGVETFAYSYYLFRPAEHNLTSEWNFIYNKAHNEYLNFAANSGTFGILSYLVLIGFSIYQIFIYTNPKHEARNTKQNQNSNFENSKLFSVSDFDIRILSLALLAGYTSLIVTNFFGFSVVPTQLEFFLFPALAITLAEPGIGNQESGIKKATQFQKISIAGVVLVTAYMLLAIGKYWNADRLYALGVSNNTAGKLDVATKYLTQAISLEPNQAIYYGGERGLAYSYANIALALNQQKQSDQAIKYSDLAIAAIDKAITLSPANINLKRVRFGIFIMLSSINPNYFIDAKDTLEAALAQAPTDAKLYYNLGLVYARIGQKDKATGALKKAIELKADYKDARLAQAYLLIDTKKYLEAKTQLEYILTKIDPNDSLSKQALEGIK